jgi:putative cell wall-binding protein
MHKTIARLLAGVTALAVGLGGVLMTAPPVHANPVPQFNLEIVSVPCGDKLFWQPRLSVTPGVSWTGRFTVKLRGDDATLQENGSDLVRTLSKDFAGYATLDTFEANAPLTGVNWATLGNNPRFVITWTYGVNDQDNTANPGGTTITVPVPKWTGPTLTVGSGTAADPYLVSTVAQVNEMRCHAGATKHFRLTNDIDLAGVDFLPLGVDLFNNPMVGTIDGAGYAIRNLTVDLPQTLYVGFVGAGSGLVIRNIRFVDASVSSLSQNQGTAVVLGNAQFGANLVDVTVTGSSVRAHRISGLLTGYLRDGAVVRPRVDGTLTVAAQPYLGDPDRLETDYFEFFERPIDSGGLAGYLMNVTVQGGTLDLNVVGAVPQLSTVAGFIGKPDDYVSITAVDADISIDLVTRQTDIFSGGVSGLFGDNGLDNGNALTDSTFRLDMRLTAPTTSDPVRFRHVGGIAGQTEEGAVLRTSITGSLTIDTRAATGTVEVAEVGGAFGRVNQGFSTRLSESHVDVDVVIWNSRSTTTKVGALVGSSQSGVFTDVRVDGTVTINGDAEEVGGLAGHTELRNSRPLTRIDSVIYRGSVNGTGTRTDVGTIFGGNGTVEALVHNTWWDSSRNSITSADGGRPGSPATAEQLGTQSWLTGQGFNAQVWCVSNNQPVVRTLRGIQCDTVVSAPGGGASGVRVAEPVRVGGVNRFATAATLSQRFFGPRVPVVYLATAEDFADALAAGPLAAGNGPVLMVLRNEIPAATLAELRRLNPGRVVVLGGPAAVSDAVLDAARATTTGSVTRLFGTDRYATAVAIAKTNHAQGASVVYVATGADFADALGGGPRAMRDGGPILLVQRDVIPSVTLAEIERLSPDRIVVLGGPDAVSEAVARKLRAFAPAGVSRLAGMDRYATSVAISQAGFEPGVEVVFLANGRGYGDALPAGAAAGGRGPVLLVREDCVPLGVYRELERLKAGEVIMVGGTAALGDGVTSLRLCAS